MVNQNASNNVGRENFPKAALGGTLQSRIKEVSEEAMARQGPFPYNDYRSYEADVVLRLVCSWLALVVLVASS